MATMVSPAGNMEVTFTTLRAQDRQLMMGGRFGAWDATIYVTPVELRRLLRMAMRPSVLMLVLRLPFLRTKSTE